MAWRDDRGFLLGDGLFETVLATHGRLVALEAHVARLARGCDLLGLPAPNPGALRRAAAAALRAAGLEGERAAVRLNWTAGSGGRGLDRPAALAPRLSAAAAPAPRPEGPARLVTVSTRRNHLSLASRVKSLSYLDNVLARREARAAGGDEALVLNAAGQVAGGAAANLFWVRDGVLFTPALACGVLDGTVRAEVLAAARKAGVEVVETAAEPGELAAAQAAFLTNSLIGIRPVASLDGRPLGEDALVQRLAQLVQAAPATISET